jgi:hypothetical protein
VGFSLAHSLLCCRHALVAYAKEENSMHRLLSFGSILLLVVAAGCNNSTLDHDSAVKVSNSALTATTAANANVMTNSTGGGHIDVTLTSVGGGTAHVVGTVSKSGDVLSTVLDITFDHWTDVANNVTLDGTLHEDGTFSSPLPLAGTVHLDGDLAASGSVSGTADFDIDGSYSTSGFSVTGHVGGQSIDVTLSI